MRKAGVLLHISSLPGPGPIGSIGPHAYKFIDFLEEAGQSVWQVLPLNPPAFGNSPYSAFSVFAGNPLLIDLTELERDGLIPAGSVEALSPGEPGRTDYEAAAREIMPLLRAAFEADAPNRQEELDAFRAAHAYWLEDYALYMAIRVMQGDISFYEWPPLLAVREKGELSRMRRQLTLQMDFWIYVQYLFFRQWKELRRYANEHGIRIMGDMPIYPAQAGADIWAHPELFLLDAQRRPRAVAGVPPDAFAPEGQRWGNPLYDWAEMKRQGYAWWIERLRVAGTMYDDIRIDHFRAFDEYYAIPARASTAATGLWERGPGMDFFGAVYAALPGLSLIAEDLGTVTDSVRALLRESGLTGMRVLLFAFDPHGDSDYLPHNMERDCVAYIGTHDNDTAYGWVKDGNPEEVLYAAQYFYLTMREGYNWGLIRGLYGTVAQTVIVQMQDLLGLDNSARMNTPATPQGNWGWRMRPDDVTSRLARKVHDIAARYRRLPAALNGMPAPPAQAVIKTRGRAAKPARSALRLSHCMQSRRANCRTLRNVRRRPLHAQRTAVRW